MTSFDKKPIKKVVAVQATVNGKKVESSSSSAGSKKHKMDPRNRKSQFF